MRVSLRVLCGLPHGRRRFVEGLVCNILWFTHVVVGHPTSAVVAHKKISSLSSKKVEERKSHTKCSMPVQKHFPLLEHQSQIASSGPLSKRNTFQTTLIRSNS